MTTNNAEVGRINQSVLDAELLSWVEQDKLVVKGHPKETEYLRVSEQAKSTIQRMSMALTMLSGYPILEQGAGLLKSLYESAVNIRSAIAADGIRRSFGLKPGQTVEGVLEPEIERATASLGTGYSAAINADLKNLALAFGINPADVLKGNVPGNKFFMNSRGKVGVNFRQVDKARETINQLRAAGKASPELTALANRFEAGLQQVEATDAFGSAHHRWYNETFAGKRINTKPLRVIGGLFGAFVTTVGIGQTVFSKNHSLSPATVGWGIATMFFANPTMLKSGGFRSLGEIAALGSPYIHDLVTGGFKGPLGKAAFEELQQIRRNKPRELKALQKSQEPLSMAHLGALAKNPNSPLMKTLAKLPEEKRVIALRTFGASMSSNEAEFLGHMLEARV